MRILRTPRIVPRVEACSRPRRRSDRRPSAGSRALAWQSPVFVQQRGTRACRHTARRLPILDCSERARIPAVTRKHRAGTPHVRTSDTPARPEPRSRASPQPRAKAASDARAAQKPLQIRRQAQPTPRLDSIREQKENGDGIETRDGSQAGRRRRVQTTFELMRCWKQRI